MKPTAPAEREPILDALRGFAVLGILPMNLQVMRGPEWFMRVGGAEVAAPESPADALAQFVVGWLVTGKFVSSLALLFGLGAALIAARALREGVSPRPLLARRYAWVMVFGLAHMLVYPGDILFVYGVTGLALLAFVRLSVPALLAWAFAIFALYSAAGLEYLATLGDVQAYGSVFEEPSADAELLRRHAQALHAYTQGTYPAIAAVHAWQAVILQTMQLAATPWVLALFLVGYAAGRAGVAHDPGAHRALLTRGAWLGLGLGLPANFGLGLAGPLAGWGPPAEDEPLWLTQWSALGELFGEPVLAVGYLCGLALVFMRCGAPRPLVAVGRLALTAYLAQSALALIVFGGLRLYGELSDVECLLVAAGIWTLLLVACPLWLRRFALGPAEWLWRALTYGRT